MPKGKGASGGGKGGAKSKGGGAGKCCHGHTMTSIFTH